jgi:hypothetical protein
VETAAHIKMNMLRPHRSKCTELHRAKQNLTDYNQRERARIKQLENDIRASAIIINQEENESISLVDKKRKRKRNDADNQHIDKYGNSTELSN